MILNFLVTATTQMFLFALVIITVPHLIGGSPPELRLRKDLMHDYNPLERPVERSEDPVVVTLGVAFQQIINLVYS